MTEMKNAQEFAYQTIREAIVNGTYPGEMKLVEEKVAAEIGVSRTPVREAVRRLEQEGLVKNKRVFKPSETDLRHLFEMRILIESHAAEKAAMYMLDEDIEKLRMAITAAKNSTLNDEIIAFNKQFHDLIVAESRNTVMIDTVNRMQAVIYMFSRTVVMHRRPGLLEEHEEVCRAIEKREPLQAREAMKTHLEADLDFTLRANV